MLSRRALIAGGATLVAGATAWFARNRILGALFLPKPDPNLVVGPAPALADMCVVTPALEEGPFFVQSAVRSDIREGKPGKEMDLALQVVSADGCTPVAGATVEIWHCDAEGNYSGHPEDMSKDLWKAVQYLGDATGTIPPVTPARYLRGAQVSDANGMVRFTSIVPGWYVGRVPHIHFKVLQGTTTQFTGQFVFDETFTEQVYASVEPYSRYGASPTTTKNDGVLQSVREHRGLMLSPTWNPTGPIRVEARIGLAGRVATG